MCLKSFYIFLLILFSFMCIFNGVALSQVDTKDGLNIQGDIQSKFSSEDQSIENFSCDILFPLEEKNVLFKIAYKKDKFFNISCFNDTGIEFLSIANNNIRFISKGKYFCYLKKDVKVQFSYIVTEEDVEFTPAFNSKGGQEKKDGFLIDISKMINFLLSNKEVMKTKRLSKMNGDKEYQFKFEKNGQDRTSDILLSFDPESKTFSSLEITIKLKDSEQKKIFRISNIIYNSSNFNKVGENKFFEAMSQYYTKDIEIVDKEFEGKEFLELLRTLLSELSVEGTDAYYYHSGLINLGQGKEKEAMEDFRKVIEVSRNDINAYRTLSATFLAKEDFKNALYYSEEGLRLFPDDSDLYQNKGMSLVGLEDYKSAEIVLKEAIKLGEKSNKTIYFSHLGLAKCYIEYKTRDYIIKALEELKITDEYLADKNDNEEEKEDVSRLIKNLEDKLKKK